MDRFVCIHGHFYQPPRENPWLEAVEYQDSAYPHHDWNERILQECYSPNAFARILDSERYIESIVNNYASISFNFGPTLLSWLERHAPKTYSAILEADRASRDRFSGHGSGMAQAYGHMILPLASERDRRTQVRWGIRDFVHRFGRRPEGMWLPETAVDLVTLDLLAREGIAFTILAPRQARRVRLRTGTKWRDLTGGQIDPTRPYSIPLPSGREIAVFFYDGPISQAIAFEGLLGDGERYARRILDGFSDRRDWTQLVHVATDGESYGHHHRFGEMALSFALRWLESGGHARLTNYGEHLERFPPTHLAEIEEGTSWSCNHGVGRWWRDCGCSMGRNTSWTQAWRTPLREAFDWLRDSIAPLYERHAGELLGEPWAARDDYIDVVLDRSPGSQERFLARHARRQLERDERIRALRLLEIQRHAMLMYTSCGWFFDDISGIEAVQVLRYAGRVVQLAGEVFGPEAAGLERALLERLALARSNVAEHGDAARIYDRQVKPIMVDLHKVGAHYGISSLFDSYGEEDRIYCYRVRSIESHRREAGKSKLLVGRIEVESIVTGEFAPLGYGVFHFGDHNLQAGVHAFRTDEEFGAFVQETFAAFDGGGFAEVIRILDRHFGGISYSLRTLFLDRQREITKLILGKTLEDAERRFNDIYEQHAPLMRFLSEGGIPPPPVLQAAAQLVLNSTLRRLFESEPLDLVRIKSLMEAARAQNVQLDVSGLSYALGRAIHRLMKKVQADPGREETLVRLAAAAKLARSLPFDVNLWSAQNLYYEVLQEVYPSYLRRPEPEAARWVREFTDLGESLSVRVRPPAAYPPAPPAAAPAPPLEPEGS